MTNSPWSITSPPTCSSRKYPYPSHGRLTKIPEGRGVSKAQFCKGKYENKLEFPDGFKPKTPSVGKEQLSGTRQFED